MAKIYLYMGRRDKKGVKILHVFQGNAEVPPTRVGDVSSLGLPPNLVSDVEETAHKNRMMWELLIESADDFKDLQTSLTQRGYSSLPMSSASLYAINVTIPNTETKPTRKTMIRRKA